MLMKSPWQLIGRRSGRHVGSGTQHMIVVHGCLQALLRELRQELEEKDFRNTDDVGGISVSIRFSNYRVDHMFQSIASVRVRCVRSLRGVYKSLLIGLVSTCGGKGQDGRSLYHIQGDAA